MGAPFQGWCPASEVNDGGCPEKSVHLSEALDQLIAELRDNEARKQEQAAKGFDGLTFFVYRTLLGAHTADPEAVSTRIRDAFLAHPNWKTSESALRELRQQVTFALVSACDELEQVTPLVEELFTVLAKGDRLA